LNLGAKIWVVSRSPKKFLTENPRFQNQAIAWIESDVRHFSAPKDVEFTHIIHAATDVMTPSKDPTETLEVCRLGTLRMIEASRRSGNIRFLLVSSGSVYGQQPSNLPLVSEDYLSAPQANENAYTIGKRLSEKLVLNSEDLQAHLSIARCFAFAGPLLPLNAGFAFTDFMHRLLKNQNVDIKGDGTSIRSYMYPTDLAVWLWTILLKANNRSIFNVGSDRGLSIKELAQLMIKTTGRSVNLNIETPLSTGVPARYIPSVDKARKLLGLEVTVLEDEAIQRTWDYHRGRQGASPDSQIS
jgi:nucleoside-diphosphate-sugar epimerase